MTNTPRRILTLILALIFVFTLSLGVMGAAPGTHVIRVGFPIQEGFSMKDAEGNYSGYTYDYLQEIAQYTGWEYEFVEIPGDIDESLSTMLDMLAKGEIDIMGAMVKNEYTQELYDFPEYGYGFNYLTLSTTEENTAINENNYSTVKGLRVAIFDKNGSTTKSKLEAFLELNNVDYTFVSCENALEPEEAVREGRADVMVNNEVNPMEGFRTVAQFSGSQFYFALTKGNTELLNQLNSTILTIQRVKPYFDSSLHEKYFSSSSDEVYLTDAEQEYIDTHTPLKFVMVESVPPIQFSDENGALQGIAKDVLERIKNDTGMEFEYIPAKSYIDAYEMLDNGEADAICGIPYDYSLAQTHDLVMSSPFLSTQTVLVIKDGSNEELSGKTLGIVNNYSKTSPNDYVPYDSIEECMQAVLSGRIDGAYVNLYSAEYLTHYAQYKGLRLIPQAGETSDFCFGIKKPLNVTIISIINKVLSNIPASELEAITYQNTITTGNLFTLSTFIYENPFLFVGIVTGLFIVLVIIGMWIMHIRIRAEKRLNVENQRYLQLCELANEYIYEYDCRQDTLIFSKEFSKRFMLPAKINKFSAVANGTAEIPEQFSRDLCRIFKEIISAADENDIERLCPMPNGDHRWYRCTRAEIKDADGRMTYIIGKLSDVQSEKEEKDNLEKQILLDGLTGIYNAESCKKMIREKLHSLVHPGAVLIIDIDYFKNVNDRLGHYMGDVVLKDFARTLSDCIGKWDIAGRLGGDEFIAFIDGDYEAASRFCAALCEKAHKEYSGPEGVSLTTTISVGAAVVTEDCSFTELYQEVDKQLYISKNNGRDRFTIIEYRCRAPQ